MPPESKNNAGASTGSAEDDDLAGASINDDPGPTKSGKGGVVAGVVIGLLVAFALAVFVYLKRKESSTDAHGSLASVIVPSLPPASSGSTSKGKVPTKATIANPTYAAAAADENNRDRDVLANQVYGVTATADAGGHAAMLNMTYGSLPSPAARTVDVGAPVFAIPMDGESGLAFIGNNPGAATTGRGYVNQNMVAQVLAEEEEAEMSAAIIAEESRNVGKADLDLEANQQGAGIPTKQAGNNMYDAGVPTAASNKAKRMVVVEDTAAVGGTSGVSGARYLPVNPIHEGEDWAGDRTLYAVPFEPASADVPVVKRVPNALYIGAQEYASIVGESET